MTHYCPKCGSTFIQGESEGTGGGRFHWCMSCQHMLYRSFPTKPPKNPKLKAKAWEEIQEEDRRKRAIPLMKKGGG